MSDSNKLTHEEWVRAWFEKAWHDIGSARQMLSAKEPFADIACFHTQQCAEKCLKGFLTAQREVFGKTHDLTDLLDACVRYEASFDDLRDHCEHLNDYAVEVRYPADLNPEPTMKDAAAALDAAARIRAFTRAQVPFDVPWRFAPQQYPDWDEEA